MMEEKGFKDAKKWMDFDSASKTSPCWIFLYHSMDSKHDQAAYI